MKKYDMKNSLSTPWHQSQFYTVDGIELAYTTKQGQDYICPYGEPPMTRYQLENRGHVVIEPRIPRFL